jgi:hypothetical protein
MKRPCCVPIVCILYYSSTQALHTLEYSTLLALDSVLNLSWTSAAPFYARLQLPVLARSAQTILNGASQNECVPMSIPTVRPLVYGKGICAGLYSQICPILLLASRGDIAQ